MSVLIFFPLFGIIVDKFGMVSIHCIFANILVLISGILLAFSMMYIAFAPACNQCYNILPGTILFSVSYSLYVPTLWTSPSLVVNKSSIGLAYGYIGSIRNMGVSLIAIFTGIISDKYGGY